MTEDRKTWLAQIESASMQVRLVEMKEKSEQAQRVYTTPHTIGANVIAVADESQYTLYGAHQRITELEQALQTASEVIRTQNKMLVGWERWRQGKAALPSETEGDRKPIPNSELDRVIDALEKRVMPRPDRVRLRGALDKADAPLGGKEGANDALGRAIRFGDPTPPIADDFCDIAKRIKEIEQEKPKVEGELTHHSGLCPHGVAIGQVCYICVNQS